ncbi:MAG: PQQ-binding-like beta-propeller repeat protein, partial [bacterium]|nr:PQQ-binding-like beta-propeller repeat protein [bacterium]
EVLWLQSPGLFHSNVFDKPPWKGRFSEAERRHFCLTATDAEGEVLWQVGEPWDGDRPFVTHSAERALDAADLDGDGGLEIVCVRRDEVLVLDGKTGAVEKSVEAPADNAQIVRIGHTGPGSKDWTILVKNAESAYPPHEYGNPAWFYDAGLNLLKTADYLGAGHMPLPVDADGDGLDEFIIGFNLVDDNLETVWQFQPVPEEVWDAGEMHADDIVVGDVGGRLCVVVAASDTAYVLDAKTGELLWKRKGTHPQHCQIGPFHSNLEGNQIFIHNKRAELQLFGAQGDEFWNMMPPRNFPLGAAEPCRRQQFHVFDPTTMLPGMGEGG